MNPKTPLAIQILVSTFFIVLLSVPIVLGLKTKKSVTQETNEQAKATALDLFGFYIEEVSDQVGVDFIHQPPKLDVKLDHILPQIASVGASVSVCDFNNDGWNDFYLTTSKYGEHNALYKNLTDGSFENVADELGVGNINKKGTGVSMGSVWADFDNDGFEDLFVYKWGKPELFLNLNGQGFENISSGSGLPAWINSNAAIWFDYNNDGNIDLLIGGYYKEQIDLWNLENTIIMPESFEYANNGGRNYLLENLGDGRFKDVTFDKRLISTKWTLAIGAMDFDNNGFQDLFIANDYSVDELYLNIGGKEFKEIGKESKIGYAPKSGMNVSMADVKNDGKFSIYVSNITEMGILLQGNNLWQPVGNVDRIEFKNRAGISGIELGGWSYGSQFGDLNNDGFQDLYLANGFISATKNNSYWYDYSKITGGNKTIISDASNWPAIEGRSQSGYQLNKIWVNSKQGVFADVTEYVSGIPPYDSRAVAMADLWNRGVLDVIVANQNNNVSVLKNYIQKGNNWIGVKLEGTISNKSAIGAIITLVWDNHSQSQVISGGIGFSSQNQRGIHFGIGKSASVDKLIIKWPSGIEQIIESLEVNKIHKIKEGNEIS
ncbi:MAG: CRTAC1 family protein [Cyclobacteriaceae bacterium]|nr:CRTAC1 family protein [Cyclobacteriaceae bacterium]